MCKSSIDVFFMEIINEWSKTWSNYDEGRKSEWSQWMKHKECEENYESEALGIETLMLIRHETQNMQ